MPVLRVLLDGNGASEDLAARGLNLIHLGNYAPEIRIAYLSSGMASGKPSVGFIFELPDGNSYVIAETSASLFVAAANMIRAKAEMQGILLP